jgi:hypothetical protein
MMESCVERIERIMREAPKVGQRVHCPGNVNTPASEATVVSVAAHPGPGAPNWVGANYVWVQVRRDDGLNPIYWPSTQLVYEKE